METRQKAPAWKQPIEAVACDDAHLRIETVQALIGRGRSSIYEMVATGSFPAPVRRARWRAGDVKVWLQKRAPA